MQRRQFLKNIAIAAAAVLVLPQTQALAADAKKEPTVEELIAQLTASKGANASSILVAPAIAENGLVVPLRVRSEERSCRERVCLYV